MQQQQSDLNIENNQQFSVKSISNQGDSLPPLTHDQGPFINGLSLLHKAEGSPAMKLNSLSGIKVEGQDASNLEHETLTRFSVSNVVQPSSSASSFDNCSNYNLNLLPSFDGFAPTASRPAIDVHQYVQDMKLSSFDFDHVHHHPYPYQHRQQNPSSIYWVRSADVANGSRINTDWKGTREQSYSNSQHVYPSPEEKSPPTPASFAINPPPFSSNGNSGTGSNQTQSSYTSTGMMSPPSTSSVVAYNPSTSTTNAYSGMGQDAMASMFFTQSKPAQMETSNIQYHASDFPGSYPNNSSALNSFNHRHQFNPSSHYQQQQDTIGSLRINTRLNNNMVSLGGGIASSIPSSLASAHSSMDMSFFYSPLSESILSNLPHPSSTSAKPSGAIRKNGSTSGPKISRWSSVKTGGCSKNSTDVFHPDQAPREQRIKFPGDLYTPKWVRYHGAAKEGLCDLCDGPGKWLQLKNSAFWYHKQFVHGVSSVTSIEFAKPTDTRLVWMCEMVSNRHCVFLASEGFCYCCNEWVPLAKNRKRHSQTFDCREDALNLLTTPPLSVVCYEPAIKAVAANDTKGNLFLPAGMKVNGSMVIDLVQEPLGSTWFRHAFKCHAASTIPPSNFKNKSSSSTAAL